MKKLQRMMAVLSLTALAGCGGGGGGSSAPVPQPVSGKVVDGYISGAKVCLDVNQDKVCQDSEPHATTNLDGSYTIPNVLPSDLAKYPILVEVPATAVDSDKPGVQVGQPYTMSAPAGSPAVVSPLTTLVQSQIEVSGQSVGDAVKAIQAQLGLTTLSPMDDYKASNGSQATIAAQVAKVVATSIAQSTANIQGAVGSGASVEQVVKLSVQQALQSLPTVAQAVQTAVQGGQTTLSDADITQLMTSSGAAVQSGPNLAAQLAQTTATASTVKLTLSLQGDGAGSVAGAQTTIALPAAVTVRTDSTGKGLGVGVMYALGSAANDLVSGSYNSAASTLTVGLVGTSALAAGDFLTVNLNVAAGAKTPTAADFTLSGTILSDATAHAANASLAVKIQ